MTLREAIELVLNSEEGKYIGESDWRKNVEHHLGQALRIIGDLEDVTELRNLHYRKLWCHLAAAHVADPSKSGPRAAEMIVGSLRGAMIWLAQWEHIPPNTGLPVPGWKRVMQEEWVRITGKPIPPARKPRYTVAETARLWAALPKADPRLAVAVTIGAERRLGQVIRCRRSDIFEYDGHVLGGIRIHGRGKKRGGTNIFTTSEREVMSAAMSTGVLSDLECAYQLKEIPDYILTSGGYLAKGKAQIKNALRPMGKSALRTYWRELETIADVEHIEGRGWYGLRRISADLAEDVEGDARVLCDIGGWDNNDTRVGYQQQGRLDIALRSANTRDKIRHLQIAS